MKKCAFIQARRATIKSAGLGLTAALALCAAATHAQTWSDNFDTYANNSVLSGQGGWTDTSGSQYAVVPGGGVAGSKALGTGDNTLYWTGHSWNWSALNVGDKVVAMADFQASTGGGGFDDDRVGWAEDAVANRTSSYHFGTQLDTASDGGLVTYFRTTTGSNVKNILIPTASLGTVVAGDWYRQELDVTKLTSGLGANGAQLTVYYSHLDASGNVIGTPLTANVTLDTSAWRGFTATVDPIYKNFTAPGNMDNAFFAITSIPEPTSWSLFAIGALALIARRRKA
jgi:hypothetical protein